MFMEKTISMLNAVSKLYNREKQVELRKRKEGEYFNIFNTLGLRTEEVRLHSAFIAELLNPKGSHGLEHRFLQAFLETIGVSVDYLDFHRCSENMVERVIGPVTDTEGGRIDIIIEDGSHAIIIENKIYANDQKNQMLRYNNYGRKEFPNGYKLLYLTLDGHEPEMYSLENDDYERELISYEKDIVDWLEKCYSIAEGKPLAQSVIKQYCELVKQITNSDMDTKYREELLSIMLAPENAIAVGEMLQLEDEWFGMILEKYIWDPLEKLAKQKKMLFGKELEDKTGTSNGTGAWIYREEWKYYGIFIWTTNRKYWADMFVGISWYEVPNWKNKIFKKDRKDCKLNCLTSLDPNDVEWPYGWEFLPNDIRNWNYEIIDKIVQGIVFDYIKKKFEEMISEIDELQLKMP